MNARWVTAGVAARDFLVNLATVLPLAFYFCESELAHNVRSRILCPLAFNEVRLRKIVVNA